MRVVAVVAKALVHVGLLVLLLFSLGAVGNWNLTIVHSGDTFGAVVAVNVASNPCSPTNTSYTSALPFCLGGVARRAALVGQLRSEQDHTLVVDTGNTLPGANYFLFSPEVVNNLTKHVSYDVVKLDLYDMQGGLSLLSSFVSTLEASGTTTVCSNLVGVQNESALVGVQIKPYTTITYADGQVVGFAGSMPANIAGLISQPGTLDSTDEIRALQVAVGSLLNMGVNKIVVAVSTIQIVESLVQAVLGIDVVLVQGHLYSNSNGTGEVAGPYPVVEQLLWQQKVCIAGVGVWGKYLGKLDVVFDDHGVVESCSGNSVPLDDTITPDADLQAQVMIEYNRSIADMGRIIGSTEVSLDYNNRCMFGECGLGSWAADVLRQAGRTDMSLINGGAFGGAIAVGDITLQQFVRSFPFPADLIVTMKLKGKHLLAVLEHSVSLANETSFDISQGIGRFLQVSGVRFTFNAQEAVGMRIVNAWVQRRSQAAQEGIVGERADSSAQQWDLVDEESDYSMTTISYLSSGGDGYSSINLNAFDVQTTVFTAAYTYREAFAAGPVMTFNTGLIAASSATRRSCIAPGTSTLCNSNGDCIAGVCQCSTPGTGGTYCSVQSASGTSGSDNSLAIALGVVLPLVFMAVVTAVLIAVVVLGYMKYKRPKLILKEPNYQLLVWRRDSLDSGEVKMLPMRRLSVKVQSVLEEFLMDKHVVQAIGNLAQAKPAASNEVAAALMLVYQSADRGVELIRMLLKNELMAFDDDKVLFREDTPGVKAFSVFSRMVGMPYLWNTFALPIAELELANNSVQQAASTPSRSAYVSDSDPSPFGTIFSLSNVAEINPSMLEEGQDNSIGRLQLELILQKLASRIFSSVPFFPLYLRQLCHMLYEDMRYDHPDYIHRVLGNLIFLRFICPALLVPQSYGLTKNETHPKTHRTLILIAKVLQNLANKNEFSGKEQFMEVMNGFIERNLTKVETFFDALCAESEEPRFGEPPTSIVPRQFRKKALMVLYQFVRMHSKDLQEELSEFPAYAVQESLERLQYITRDIDSVRDIISGGEDSESDCQDDHDVRPTPAQVAGL